VAVLFTLGLDSEHRIVGVFLVCFGVFNVIWHCWDKHKWFSGRREANVTGSDAEIRFEDDRIFTKGPFSQSESDWKAFQKVVSTKRGMFLYPQQGLYIYIPDSALQPPESKADIVNRNTGN
jgi:hypothetical protein